MKNNIENSAIPLSVKDFKALLNQKNIQIIDTRLPDYFEMGNVPGAINFGFKPDQERFKASLFQINEPTVLVCKPKEEAIAYATLESFGFTNIMGHLKGGMDSWLNQSEKYDMVISISSEELALDSKHNAKAVVLDVREPDEFNSSHVFNAQNIPLSELAIQHAKLTKTGETLIYSNNGFRSMIASSYLKKVGFTNIKNVWGGFEKIKLETIDLVGKK